MILSTNNVVIVNVVIDIWLGEMKTSKISDKKAKGIVFEDNLI